MSKMIVPSISDRMAPLNPSAVREIFKLCGRPEVISFAGGNPSERTFPDKELAQISAELYAKNPAGLLQYGISEGYGPLREMTLARLRTKFGIGSDNDDILIVNGGQQGIDLCLKVLTNEGDTVICEDPSFIGALNDIRSYKLNLVGIKTDRDGMDIDALEEALKTEKNVKIIYTIPAFQNPLGVTLSAERRKRMYELAVKYNVVILEDSPYFELRYYGMNVPAIKTLDQTGHVIFCGSYSKTVAPGLRVGHLVLDKSFVQKFTVAKQCVDVHTSNYSQMLIAEYIANYDFEGHVENCRCAYRVQRDLMLNGLDKALEGYSDFIRYTRPEGGLFVWVDLPTGKSGYALFEALVAKNLATVPGGAFDTKGRMDMPGLRLNFSMPSPKEIVSGVEILCETLKEFIK